MGNAPYAISRYAQFKAWTADHRLVWAGIGLDIEPDIREMQELMNHRSRIVPFLLSRLFRHDELYLAQLTYQALVKQIRADGYAVDSYLIPFVLDERRTGSTLLQRLTGLIDIEVDREVLMLYTSFMGTVGPGVLWSYASEAQSIGLGNTGGGVEIGNINQLPPLTWPDLLRDLRLARMWTDDIHLFSLEGCVRYGLLEKLSAFDWEESYSMTVPTTASRIEGLRQIFRTGLWAGSHPWLVVAALWMIIAGFRRLTRPKRS
jgi:hypothetical protein